AAVAAIERASGGVLDGVVACAGVGPQVEDRALIVSLNYFGAQRLLDGLRGALARGTAPAAVAISSNSSTLPTSESPLVGACLDGDEETARRLAATLFGGQVYGGPKLAPARWLRRCASSSDWPGARTPPNAGAPA